MTAWLTWFLFESAAGLAACSALLLFILLVRWRRGGSAKPLLAGLMLSGGLFVLEVLVVTPRERAARMLSDVTDDLCLGRVEALRAALSPRFRAGEMGREQFVDYVRDVLERVRIHAADRTALRVTRSDPGTFSVLAGYLPDLTLSNEGRVRVPSSWRLTFERDDGDWKITEIVCLQAGPLREPTWGELRR